MTERSAAILGIALMVLAYVAGWTSCGYHIYGAMFAKTVSIVETRR